MRKKVMNLDTYIRQSGYRIGFICERLGISRQAFDRKRKGEVSFKADEVNMLCEMLNITTDREYIFCPQVEKFSMKKGV